MKKYTTIFNQYFKKFDIRDKNIRLKFHHSYRVMGYAKDIGVSLKLNDHDIWLCEFIGLFHDISRFEQWAKYQTYKDKDSIDHGDLSDEILIQENILKDLDESDKDIILTAIKYHNKYDINDIKNERKKLFCEIVRDADKLDILFEQGNTISEVEETISKKLLDEIYDKRLCSNEHVITDVDIILRQIGFIFDLNFPYSLNLLKEKNWFENKFNLLENYVKDVNTVKNLKKFINEYVEERIKC